MTTYCLSSTVRSRPTAFLFAVAGGERQPQEPVPPNYSVDTPFDDPLLDEPGEDDPRPPFARPAKKGIPDDDRNLP